ncbi:MAG: class I SAM-dependent methyltransferase [Victivallales bacterium]
MIWKKHWNRKYLVDKLNLMYWQRQNPEAPWLTAIGIAFLDNWLRKTDIGVEFGSGRSTAWFAARVARLTSIEHDPEWHAIVKEKINQLSNVEYHHVPLDRKTNGRPDYPAVLERFTDNSLDFVLVDGRYRSECAELATRKIKPGGLLVLDNSDLYFYHPTTTPSPLRKPSDMEPAWQAFQTSIQSWRQYHTSNGVFDTSFFFKQQ